ncbi:MAG: transposase [Phycisphaerales bacterium]|nr:transposase [Phycisphaerales bacterium]
MAQSYSARTLSSVNIASLAQGRDGQAVVIGVDVSKAELRLVPRWADGEFARPVRVRQPSEIGQGVGLLRELGRDRELIVAIEPTGRYGDVFRQACHRAGITVHRVSAKVSHDYAEVFDGVPSQHDGKDAALIAELAAIGKSRPWPWPEPDGWEQRLSVCAALGDAYQRQRIAWMNRIEAWLAAHWPEVQEHLWLTSATLPRILARYGSPRALAADPQAAVRLQQWGRGLLSPDRIEKILRSARETVGVEVMREEAMRVRRYAIEVLRARLRLRRYKSQMARLARAHPVTSRMAKAVGPATAGVLWLEAGDPGKYSCGRAYLKALGLNLVERSSGAYQGPQRISKRGSSRARRWLHFAAMRIVMEEPVNRWYAAKIARDGGIKKKGLTAIMRKLALALHRVAKDDVEFEPNRLFAGRRRRRRSQATAGQEDSRQEV